MTRHPSLRVRIAAVFAAVALGLGMPLAVGAPASADVQDFAFESMHADYTLGRDAEGYSTLHTVETFVALFPEFDQNRGMIRSIPKFYGDVDTEVQVLGVTDENGGPVEWFTEDEDGFVNVIIGPEFDYVHGRTTYVIEYTQAHVIRPFADRLEPHQEFYWDVNGVGWPQEFGKVTATVHLTDGVETGLNGDVACYQGYDMQEGAPACGGIERTDDGFGFVADDVWPYTTLTFAIGFEDGTFHPEPTPRDNPIVAFWPWVLLGLLGVVVLGMLWLRIFFWRNGRGRGIVIPQYEAPENLGIMESAHLVERGAAALPAELVNLTVQKAVRLVEDADAPKTNRFRLVLVDPALGVLRDDDSAIRSLFLSTTPGTAIRLDQRDRKLGDRIASLTAQARNNVRTRGFRTRKKSKLAGWLRLLAFLIGGAAVFIGFWSGDHHGGSALLTLQLTVLIAGAVLSYGFLGAPERLSDKGAEAREHLEGLRLYLTVAEEERIRVLQSPTGAERARVDPNDNEAVVKLYERLLPFAIIWGIEDEWAKVLGERYATTPEADDTFTRSLPLSQLNSFSRGFGATSFATTPPVTSSSSGGSSFSGGSSGGGSSGGGGGGGGGGGR